MANRWMPPTSNHRSLAWSPGGELMGELSRRGLKKSKTTDDSKKTVVPTKTLNRHTPNFPQHHVHELCVCVCRTRVNTSARESRVTTKNLLPGSRPTGCAAAFKYDRTPIPQPAIPERSSVSHNVQIYLRRHRRRERCLRCRSHRSHVLQTILRRHQDRHTRSSLCS